MVSEEGARAGHRHFQFRNKRGRGGRSASSSLDSDPLWMALGLSRDRPYGSGVAWVLARNLSQTGRAATLVACGIRLYPQRSNGAERENSVAALVSVSSDVGFRICEVPDRSYLVVLSLLAAEVSQSDAWHIAGQDRSAAGADLSRGGCRKCGGRLVVVFAFETRLECESRAEDGHADLRLRGDTGLLRIHDVALVGDCGAGGRGSGGTSRLVGESVCDGRGYVPRACRG